MRDVASRLVTYSFPASVLLSCAMEAAATDCEDILHQTHVGNCIVEYISSLNTCEWAIWPGEEEVSLVAGPDFPYFLIGCDEEFEEAEVLDATIEELNGWLDGVEEVLGRRLADCEKPTWKAGAGAEYEIEFVLGTNTGNPEDVDYVARVEGLEEIDDPNYPGRSIFTNALVRFHPGVNRGGPRISDRVLRWLHLQSEESKSWPSDGRFPRSSRRA